MKKLILIFTLSLLMLGMAWGQGVEDFTNSNATSSYANGSFVGNNSITWSYVASRDDNGDANSSGIVAPALMLRRSSDSSAVSSSTISGGIGDFSVKLYKGFTGSGNRQVELFINGASQGTSTGFNDYNLHTFTVTGINVTGDIVIQIKNITSTQVIVDDISWTAYASSTPTITLSESDLTGFSYELGSGPSTEQNFTVSGSNLTNDISIAATTNYEISKTSGTGYTTALTFTQSGGTVSQTTIYVRLKAGLIVGDYNGETITAISADATSKNVTCSGSVTAPPPPATPSANSATAVSHEGFTARWDAVSGATSYKLDVLTGTISELINTGFEGSTSFPDGWTVNSSYVQNNSTIAYNGTYYAGMNATDDYFYTPLLSSPTSISFWTEASSNKANNTVKIQYSDDALTWMDLATYIANGSDTGDIISTWTQKTVTANLTGNYRIRWFMSARSEGSAYFDDIVITGGSSSIVTGWDDVTVTEKIQRVDELDPSTNYTYRVRSCNTNGTSSNSNTISVSTTATTTGEGANTAIGGASTVVSVAPLAGFTNNTVEIDPDTITNDDFTVTVTGDKTGLVYTITTNNNLALNGVYELNHNALNGLPTNVVINMGEIVDPIYAQELSIIEINGIEAKSAKGTLTIRIDSDGTLPVELSSFTIALNGHHKAVLTWVTQSETGVSGFYIYRNSQKDLATADMISNLIPATNTSQQKIYVYTDKEPLSAGTHYYWLQVADFDGSDSFHGPLNLVYGGDDSHSPGMPNITVLKSVYPNPFNPSTTLSYGLEKAESVKITIYNSRGQVVRSIDEGSKKAGYYDLIWNGDDDRGQSLPSGVYHIRMQAGDKTLSKKAVLMK
ncbi:MAG: T9SS type A sorting domain-containing protein [Candidatus Cloacimonetes bacterium]|nr:T9SS type A sorting domain-containing protein [Candidatus Cloacimonadota bacterium]